MMPYPDVVVLTDDAEPNIELLRREVEQKCGSGVAAMVAELAAEPGMLQTCLARSSSHLPWKGRMRASVLGEVIAAVLQGHRGISPVEALEIAAPLFKWPHSIAAIDCGLAHARSAGTTDAIFADALELAPNDTLEGLWALGAAALVDIAPVEWRGRHLPPPEEVGPWAAELRAELSKQFELLLPVGPHWNRLTGSGWLLWANAAAMWCRLSPGNETFERLMRHMVDGGRWPLACDENREFRERALAKEPGLQGFWTDDFSLDVRDEALGDLHVGFLDDPIQMLNIGNIFDTCLGLAGLSMPLLLGWVTNCNIRVLVTVSDEGLLIGRKTIGLSLQDAAGISAYRTYPHGDTRIASVMTAGLKAFIADSGLEPYPGAAIADTLTEAYVDGFDDSWNG